MRNIIIISILVFFSASCNRSTSEEYITQVNELSDKLENIAEKYLKIDSVGIESIRKNVKNNCSRINYLSDSSLNSIVIRYGNINKSLRQVLRMDVQLRKSIQISRNQLDNLVHDISNNNIDTILLVQYIDEESVAINKLIDHMNYNYERIMIETSKYDSLNPIIEKLLIEQD